MIEIILFLILLSISILLIKRRFEHRPDWTKKSQTPASGAAPAPETWYSRQWTSISSKITFWNVVILLVVMVVLLWNSFFTTTHTFTTKENFPNNWQINSGSENVKVENNCLVISGPAEMALRGSENMDATEVVLVPCDKELNDVTVGIGDLDFRYYYGEPPDTNYDWDKGVIYHIGAIITAGGTEISAFLPITENLKMDNKPRSLLIERGSIIGPDYKMMARGSGGFFDSIILTKAYYSKKAGKGVIKIKTDNEQRIRSLTVTEGLLAKI